MIKTFAITGLFGDRDVSIPFDSNVKILVAENGTGKTTVLNTLYNVIAGDFSKIHGLEFQKISVTFTNGVSIEVTKDQIESLESILPDDPRVHEFISHFGQAAFHELSDMAKRIAPGPLQRHPRFVTLRHRLGISSSELMSVVRHLYGRTPQQPDLQGITLKGVREAIQKGVVESKRCAFLVATTHSPFIFQNELDTKTTDLTNYIKFR